MTTVQYNTSSIILTVMLTVMLTSDAHSDDIGVASTPGTGTRTPSNVDIGAA